MPSHEDNLSNWYSNRDMIIYKFGAILDISIPPRVALEMIKELDSWTQQIIVLGGIVTEI